MAKRRILNIKSQFKHIIFTINNMLYRHNRDFKGGLHLAPIDIDNLREIRFLAELTLKKASNTRKDLQIGS